MGKIKTTTTNNQNEALTTPTYWTQRQKIAVPKH